MDDGWFACLVVGAVAGIVAHLASGTLWVSIPAFVIGFLGTAWYTLAHD